MKTGVVIPTLGFEAMGVSKPLNVCTKIEERTIQNCLKTASGFGGCNAAVIFSK
jgi:3-oxoacyl-[acyl-carrier-protein] synthase-1